MILVGEMRDRETIEIALEASETGHLVMSTLHTIDAAKTVERIVGVFPQADQPGIRNRLAKAFQYIVSQRLAPRQDGTGRVPLLEILRSTLRTRDYVEAGRAERQDAARCDEGRQQDGMQHFDGEIERLLRADVITLETGMSYATNPNNLRLEIADLIEERRQAEKAALAAASA